MHRNDLLEQLMHHRTRYLDEAGDVARARRFVAAHPDTFHREHWPAHVSGSTWVVNPARTAVILMHHRQLGIWLQPGGHAEGDPDVRRVALRETAEETGLDPRHIHLLSEAIFDVDIHPLRHPPEGTRPEETGPRHEHIDIRYLVEIDDGLPLPGNHESFDIQWVPLDRIPRYNNSRSILRMSQKTRRLARLLNTSLSGDWTAHGCAPRAAGQRGAAAPGPEDRDLPQVAPPGSRQVR